MVVSNNRYSREQRELLRTLVDLVNERQQRRQVHVQPASGFPFDLLERAIHWSLVLLEQLVTVLVVKALELIKGLLSRLKEFIRQPLRRRR